MNIIFLVLCFVSCGGFGCYNIARVIHSRNIFYNQLEIEDALSVSLVYILVSLFGLSVIAISSYL